MKKAETITIKPEDLQRTLEVVKPIVPESAYLIIEAVFTIFLRIITELNRAKVSIRRLKQYAFGFKTESMKNFNERHGEDVEGDCDTSPSPNDGVEDKDNKDSQSATPLSVAVKKKKGGATKGNGRKGEWTYAGAKQWIGKILHLKAGDPCPDPECAGKLKWAKPARFTKVVASAPFVATRYLLDVFRCNTCGKAVVGQMPEGVLREGGKYDASCTAMLLLIHYGMGMAMNAIAKLQEIVMMGLPSSTQWMLIQRAKEPLKIIYDYLRFLAANAGLIYIDDTPCKVRQTSREIKKKQAAGEKVKYTEIVTTGIVAHVCERVIWLFITGCGHAGLNLSVLLEMRQQGLPLPLVMSDALNSNLICRALTATCLCMVHARRNFFNLLESYPKECKTIVEWINELYVFDAHCRDNKLTPAQRLAYHQEHSGKVIAKLKKYIDGLIKSKAFEPKSDMGKALNYFVNHFHELTQFLRYEGAPLDNNAAERALKKAILYRKMCYFFETVAGALMGDMAMSVIFTCKACGVNPFEYIKAVVINKAAINKDTVAQWMPWNYHEQLNPIGPGPNGGKDHAPSTCAAPHAEPASTHGHSHPMAEPVIAKDAASAPTQQAGAQSASTLEKNVPAPRQETEQTRATEAPFSTPGADGLTACSCAAVHTDPASMHGHAHPPAEPVIAKNSASASAPHSGVEGASPRATNAPAGSVMGAGESRATEAPPTEPGAVVEGQIPPSEIDPGASTKGKKGRPVGRAKTRNQNPDNNAPEAPSNPRMKADAAHIQKELSFKVLSDAWHPNTAPVGKKQSNSNLQAQPPPKS